METVSPKLKTALLLGAVVLFFFVAVIVRHWK
jgi:hypothetical protein